MTCDEFGDPPTSVLLTYYGAADAATGRQDRQATSKKAFLLLLVAVVGVLVLLRGNAASTGGPPSTANLIRTGAIAKLHYEHVPVEPYLNAWYAAEMAATKDPSDEHPNPLPANLDVEPFVAEWAAEQFALGSKDLADMSAKLGSSASHVPIEPFVARWALAQYHMANITQHEVRELFDEQPVPVEHFIMDWAEATENLEDYSSEETPLEGGDGVEPYMASWAEAAFGMRKDSLHLGDEDLGVVASQHLPIEVFLGKWAQAQLIAESGDQKHSA